MRGLSFGGKRELARQAAAREGSQGALRLANPGERRSAQRPKLWALRLHWLRPWPRRPLGDASICFTSTELQKAVMLAKPLGLALFKPSRKLSVGW